MKKVKLIALAVCGLWVVVVGTYATQLQQDYGQKDAPKYVPLTEASCSGGPPDDPPGE